jgi:hypothetical protein
MHEIAIPRNVNRMLLIAAGCLGIAGVGVAIGIWKVIALGMLCALASLVIACDRRVKLGVSRCGLWYATWGDAVFPWSDFRGWRMVRHFGATYLQFVPKQPADILSRCSRWGRYSRRSEEKLGLPPFSIHLRQFQPQINEVLAWLRDNVPECSDTFDEP